MSGRSLISHAILKCPTAAPNATSTLSMKTDGMVLCNPRDKEAAHRAEMEGIATSKYDDVTCKKCLNLMTKDMRRED